MSGNINSGTAFDYEGYLLFNGIYKTEFIDQDSRSSKSDAASTFSDKLPEYDTDDPERDDGYERILVDDAMYDDPEVDEVLEDIAPSIIAFRYKYETRNEGVEAYYEGERVEVDVPNTKDSDIYWIHPEYVYLRGALDDIKETREKTFRILSDNVRIDPIDFGGDFLLWLFYMHKEDLSFPDGIDTKHFTDGVVSGERDPFGKNNTVDDSTQLDQCVPILVGILKDKSITQLEGYFDLFDDHTVKAQLGEKNQQGRIHVKSKGAISETPNDVKRVAIALNFVNQLVELYDYWEQLSPTDKYPPKSFFADLYTTARDHGVEIERISQNVLTRYARLRNEDPDDWV
jgi:hypothetical protein